MCSVQSSGTNGTTCVKQQFIPLVLINHRDISVISKRGTGIMIDLGVAVFVQTV